jgi:hypothetical protein
LFALATAVYGAVFLLWAGGHFESYLAVLRFLGIDAWNDPFLDLDGVLSWSDCHRLGIDVLKTNPCDVLHRPFNYGPPLLWLPFSKADTIWLGLMQSVLFFAIAAAVLAPQNRREFLFAAAGLFSTVTLYAVERANIDIVLFVLIAAGGFLAARGSLGRTLSYGLTYCAGALKFYPFALFALAAREKPKAAILASVMAVSAIGTYAVLFAPELKAISHLMPLFYYNGDNFGATVLPFGLAAEFKQPWIGPVLLSGLGAVFGAGALFLTRKFLRDGPQMMALRGGYFLIAGAILLAGCFLTQANINYRAIYFLMLLPGLWALEKTPLRPAAAAMLYAIIFCLWGEFIRRSLAALTGHAYAVSLGFFIAREIVWWSVMTTALAIAITFLLQAPLIRSAWRR